MSYLARLAYFTCFVVLLFSPSLAGGYAAEKILTHIGEDVECNSNSRDKIFAIGEVNTKSYFWGVNGAGAFKKSAYVINKDKIMIFSAYKNYYCVGFMRDYNFDKIYYGFIEKENIIFDKYLTDLSQYIGKWQQDDGSLFKFFELKRMNNELFMDMEVDIDDSIAQFYTNSGYIDFDLKTQTFKARAIEQGGDQFTNCYYRFYKYHDYLVVVDYNQKNNKCVTTTAFNMSGIYKVSHNNN